MEEKNLGPRQLETLRKLHVFRSLNGFSPSEAELAEEMGVCQQNVSRALRRLLDKNLVSRVVGVHRSLQITREGHRRLQESDLKIELGDHFDPEGK